MHVYECGEQGARELTKYEAIWDYETQPKEWVTHCNLCERPANPRLDQPRGVDRYGFSYGWVFCPSCDLHFIAHRMTREAYARFYESGAYRRLVSAFHGRDVMATIEQEQEEYAARLTAILRPWAWPKANTLLDIGGSTGVVAGYLRDSLGMIAAVLDPAQENAGRFDGVIRLRGTIEDHPLRGTWDLITLCQTADHLLDLMGSLRKIKSLLSPEGLFWSDIVDFDVTREVKIDHPFNLTERTYRMFLEKAGFKLLQINYAPDGRHIGFLCRAAE